MYARAPHSSAAAAANDRYIVPAGPTAANLQQRAAGPCWDRRAGDRRTVSQTLLGGVRRMNEVNARRTRLVPGWVTVFGRVYHLGM